MLRTLEVVIGIGMITTIFLIFYSGAQDLPEFDIVNWKIKGFTALNTLNENNELRNYVLANNTLGLKNRLSHLLPKNLNLEVVICELDCEKPEIGSEKIASVSYLVAGKVNQFGPKQVILFLW
jgi:hypothetical protein